MSKPPYLYSIGHYGHYDSYYSELYHDSILDENDLEDSIAEAVAHIIQKQKGDDEVFGDIHDEVCNYLVESKGFRRLKFQATWNCPGFPLILDKEDWGELRGDELNSLSDKVKKRLECQKSS